MALPDDEIITNLAILLPLWRKQLGLPEQSTLHKKNWFKNYTETRI
jgi:hypothetical protein